MPKGNQAKVKQALELLNQAVTLLKSSHQLGLKDQQDAAKQVGKIQEREPHLFESMENVKEFNARQVGTKLLKFSVLKETIPEAGAQSFILVHNQVRKYTIIGADNIHHAENKATKLCGYGWHHLISNNADNIHYIETEGMCKYMPVKAFNQLLALLRSSP